MNAPSGRSAPPSSPAPLGSSVTDAGMRVTTQCQKPLAVGASGSEQVTAKPRAPSGKPDQDSWGERSSPPSTPNLPLVCGIGRVSPSEQSLLVTVKAGTWGRKSYGFGGAGRSAMGTPSDSRGATAGAVLDRDPRHHDRSRTSRFARPAAPCRAISVGPFSPAVHRWDG